MWSRIARLMVTIVLPGFFLYLFARRIDPDELRESLQGVGYGWWLLILAAFIQILHLILRAMRWRILLEPQKKGIGYYNLFSTVSIGYLVTMLLPGRIGEFLRPILLANRENISKTGSLATILLERLMDALAVSSLLAVYLIFFTGGEGSMGREAMAGLGIGTGWTVFAGTLIVLAFPALWVVVHFRAGVARLLEKIIPLSSRFGKNFHQFFHAVIDGFAVLKGGRALVFAWGYTYAIWLVIAYSIWFSLLAFDIRIPIEGSLLMLAALVFGIAIPTQGGVGTYEFFGQEALTRFFGIDPSQAGAAVLVMHIFAIFPVILIGFGFLWKEGISFSSLKAVAKSDGDAGSSGSEDPASETENRAEAKS
jgi:uncharacterized protein (TIRG00374 family)